MNMWSNSLPSVLQSRSATAYASSGQKVRHIAVFVTLAVLAMAATARSLPGVSHTPVITPDQMAADPPVTLSTESILDSQAAAPGSSDVKTDINVSTSSQAQSSAQTDVTVNGNSITLPPNSSYHTTVEGDGSSQVHVNVQSTTDGSTQSNGHTNIHMHTFSHSNNSTVTHSSE